MALGETFGERATRRLYHFASHPRAWMHWIWVREITRREIYFRDHPRFLFWEPMYRVARGPLARLLGRPCEELDGFFRELAPLHERLTREVADLPFAGALSQAPLLYVLVRASRPAWAIETGISSGYSARLILEAMHRNGGGHLDSIGVESLAMHEPEGVAARSLAGRGIGWLVPDELRGLWSLHRGTSDQVLPGLLGPAVRPLDLFLHDSLHQYATMRWEYATAYARLAPGGLLASHDIHTSAAWPEFLAEQKIDLAVELDHDLGVARRPTP